MHHRCPDEQGNLHAQGLVWDVVHNSFEEQGPVHKSHEDEGGPRRQPLSSSSQKRQHQ